MKLVADEGVDKPIVDHLRSLGHDVIYILESSPGVTDQEVLKIAFQKQALLLTTDTDFGELVFRLKESTFGVLLLRLEGLAKDKKQAIVESSLTLHEEEIIENFSVLTKDTIRIRRI